MLAQSSNLIGLNVYTNNGMSVGKVTDLILDFDRMSIYGLYIENTNPELVEDGVAISVPFRIVKSIGEIIILRVFPNFVRVSREEA
ncbi:MAG: PRC-barrel domain-containing protein [Candidatus Thermoplasmatota archaeon]|nr:PRC-barrel domain-containing protein [Candidatus Thermoplasmatota archaeon]